MASSASCAKSGNFYSIASGEEVISHRYIGLRKQALSSLGVALRCHVTWALAIPSCFSRMWSLRKSGRKTTMTSQCGTKALSWLLCIRCKLVAGRK